MEEGHFEKIQLKEICEFASKKQNKILHSKVRFSLSVMSQRELFAFYYDT